MLESIHERVNAQARGLCAGSRGLSAGEGGSLSDLVELFHVLLHRVLGSVHVVEAVLWEGEKH